MVGNGAIGLNVNWRIKGTVCLFVGKDNNSEVKVEKLSIELVTMISHMTHMISPKWTIFGLSGRSVGVKLECPNDWNCLLLWTFMNHPLLSSISFGPSTFNRKTVHFDPWPCILAQKTDHYRSGASTLAQMTVQFSLRASVFGWTVYFRMTVHFKDAFTPLDRPLKTWL